MKNRERLVGLLKSGTRITADGLYSLVSLEDFFTGNQDLGSIGCNLPEHPGIEFFFQRLREIRAMPGVDVVLVAISETSDDDPDPNVWPFSDRVYVFGRVSMEQLEEWFAPLHPDSLIEERSYQPQALRTHKEHIAYYAWWD